MQSTGANCNCNVANDYTLRSKQVNFINYASSSASDLVKPITPAFAAA